MEHLKIAVVSSNAAYNRTFCMSLLHVCRQIEVTSYSTRQFVLDWADYEGPGAFYDCFDLILWAGKEISDSYGDNIVYLTDQESLAEMDYAGNRFSIYQYSPAGTIVAAVFDIYTHLTGRQFSLVRRDDVKVFAFASCCGGSGCTTLTRAFCQEMTRFRGKRVLCISLEDVESAGDFMPVTEGIKTEGEFLYRLLGKGTRPFLDSYLVKDDFGVCSFFPPQGRNPLGELTREDMNTLLAALMDSGRFDVIAADLSTCLSEAAVAVMDTAERICLIAKTPEPGKREESYRNQLRSSCGENVTGKIIRQLNAVPADREVVDIRAPLEGAFGSMISNLTDRMVNVVK